MSRRLLPVLTGLAATAMAVWLAMTSARLRASPADEAKPANQPDKVLNYEQSNGQKLFEHYCAVCHGASGEADGFNSFNLNPKPRDLSDRGAMQRFSDQQLFLAIVQGGAERGKSNLMPPWGHTLNDCQIRYLVAYLRTLGEPK
jgi:mono/diheme cytochrome c family protein